MSEEKRAPQGNRSLARILAKHQRVLILSAGRAVGWSRVMRRVDAEFGGPAPQRGGGLQFSASNDENAVNYAAAHYEKVHEDYQKVVHSCNWNSCENAVVCHGCLRKIKQFASIEEKKRPVYVYDAETQTGETNEHVSEDEQWIRHHLDPDMSCSLLLYRP